jgi:hypothetical protein
MGVAVFMGVVFTEVAFMEAVFMAMAGLTGFIVLTYGVDFT